ncbi:hypothetical protein DAI22_12g093000 [Oryza sativa Japonica Group]|nr:hypothetical protein DAI22_12g093000 [Oryza sativa Japonica Group]
MAEPRFPPPETLKIALLCLLLPLFSPATASIPSAASTSSDRSCIADERAALLAIKATFFDPNSRLASWQGEDCCSWWGVRCSNRTGHVIKLRLRGNTDDCLSFYGDKLRGEMSYSLVSLQKLRYLDLSCNNFNWSQIPVFLGSLPSLRYLNLSYGFFYGSVPPQLGNLSKLAYLDLTSYSYNQLYSVALSWLSHLSSLKHLVMNHVNLTTAVDWVDEINMLPALKVLYLKQCGLRKTVPFLRRFHTKIAPNWFWNITSLSALDIRSCGFFGSIPDEIGRMASLEEVYFQGNNLITNTTGDIRELIEKLPNCHWNKLQQLGLSYNNIGGTLPNWSEPLANLTVLLLSNTNISGAMPSSIWALTKLNILDLCSNKLNGTVREDQLGNLTNLVYLGLGNTHLQIKASSDWIPPFKLQVVLFYSLQLGSEVPPWLRSQTSIQHLQIANTSITTIPDWFWIVFSRADFLDVAYNQITGTLPATLEFMAAKTMDLSNNRFTGMVPKFPINVTYMYLQRNSLSGPLPSDFGAPLLQSLTLYGNLISGTIPSSLSCPRLVFLDLSYNQFSGNLPLWMGKKFLPILSLLRLRSNMFSGHIPTELTRIDQLQFLDLAENYFSGSIPDSLVNLSAMARTSGYSVLLDEVIATGQGAMYDINYFYELVSVQTKGQQLEFSRGISRVVNLDLSKNNLNFSWNLINGEIPETIGQLKQLESLDLSHNELSGEIPSSMQDLNALGTMNLSYNNLSGRIPRGNTMGSYDASSYIGNIGLCGPPLTRNCSGNATSKDLPRNHVDLEHISLYLGMAIGFVLSLWVVLCLLLFKTSWRKSYFMFVDRQQKKIYVSVKIRSAVLKRNGV